MNNQKRKKKNKRKEREIQREKKRQSQRKANKRSGHKHLRASKYFSEHVIASSTSKQDQRIVNDENINFILHGKQQQDTQKPKPLDINVEDLDEKVSRKSNAKSHVTDCEQDNLVEENANRLI